MCQQQTLLFISDETVTGCIPVTGTGTLFCFEYLEHSN
ncbi:hypothetical protein FJW01_03630 [Pantoea deleyi]|uniref:Uncharacterized protein n=1 Tax=Pantoea deleyi TaxID=470932 RepID=A0A506QN70_9GAMM|nr:hypothetical protein FJW01_03630 [Pantoea deleyi]